jgi:hypothetical protein
MGSLAVCGDKGLRCEINDMSETSIGSGKGKEGNQISKDRLTKCDKICSPIPSTSADLGPCSAWLESLEALLDCYLHYHM